MFFRVTKGFVVKGNQHNKRPVDFIRGDFLAQSAVKVETNATSPCSY